MIIESSREKRKTREATSPPPRYSVLCAVSATREASGAVAYCPVTPFLAWPSDALLIRRGSPRSAPCSCRAFRRWLYLVRQFDDSAVHRRIALGVFRGHFPRRARRRGAMRFGKAFALGHRKPGDAAHQPGFAGIRAERAMCDWVTRKAPAR